MSIILVTSINLNLDPPPTVIYKTCISRNTWCGRILQMCDRKIICNGALIVCLNSLVSANHKQPFIVVQESFIYSVDKFSTVFYMVILYTI